jgi:hypothetical protein
MGYRGKVEAQNRARELRAESWTLDDIANELGVAKSSVSLWVRDVEFTPSPRRTSARKRSPNKLQRAKAAQIADLDAEGIERLGELNDQAFLAAGAALYAGEGGKTDGCVQFSNTNAAMVALFCRWLRHFWRIDESRMRARLYLHEGLDLEAAVAFWVEVTGIPHHQFIAPYRADPDQSRRRAKHVFGCIAITYSCSRTHRAVMGLVRALLSSSTSFRGGATGSAAAC